MKRVVHFVIWFLFASYLVVGWCRFVCLYSSSVCLIYLLIFSFFFLYRSVYCYNFYRVGAFTLCSYLIIYLFFLKYIPASFRILSSSIFRERRWRWERERDLFLNEEFITCALYVHVVEHGYRWGTSLYLQTASTLVLIKGWGRWNICSISFGHISLLFFSFGCSK